MRLVLLLCAALALTVGVTAATAGTTIGQAGTPSNAFAFNSGVEEVPDGYVVPAGRWVVGSLNTQAAGACFVTGVYNLQVLRPLGGGQYTVLGDTGHQTDPCDGQLHSYPVNIPVQAGDVLGVYVVSVWQGLLSGGGRTFTFQPEPMVGDTVTASSHVSGFTVDAVGHAQLRCRRARVTARTVGGRPLSTTRAICSRTRATASATFSRTGRTRVPVSG